MASTTRVTSLMSGMDTDALVEEMLSASRIPLDNYEKDKTTVTWQRETLLELNSEMLAFQNASFDMKLESTYKRYLADSSNSLVAKAVAGTEAMEGTYTVRATQLATATSITSKEMDTAIRSSGWVNTTNLNLSGTSMDITLNGETRTITFYEGEGDFSGVKAKDIPGKLEELLKNKIDNAFGSGQIAVNVSQMSSGKRIKVNLTSDSELNQSIVLNDPKEGTSALGKLSLKPGQSNAFSTDVTIKEWLGGEDALDENGNFQIKINGKTLEFNGDRTLSEVFKEISNDEELDVNIKYDKVANSIIMKRDSTGAGREIQISDDYGFFSSLGLTEDAGAEVSYGQNAKVIITDPEGRVLAKKDAEGNIVDGIEMTSNNFEYEGVSFSLLKVNPEEEVSITVSKDTEEIFNSIVGFVDKYNNLLGKLNQLYNEEKHKDYEPLTDAERESLSDTQQEKWDKLARSGILRRDTTIQSAISDMRNAVTSVMNTTGIKSLFEMGISTTSYSATGYDNGKLIIDEDKLKEAINNDIDAVSSFFTSTPTDITGTAIENKDLDLAGKSMNVTVGNKSLTIEFDKNYDISDADQKDELVKFINEELQSAFGKNNVTVSISSDRVIINSLMQNNVTVNSGAEGSDALELLKLDDGAKYDSTQMGFASKIYNAMNKAMQSVKDKAGTSTTMADDSTLGQKMSRLNDYISRQKDKLSVLEERYYAQFAAMESALAQLDSQSSYLMNMLSSNG